MMVRSATKTHAGSYARRSLMADEMGFQPGRYACRNQSILSPNPMPGIKTSAGIAMRAGRRELSWVGTQCAESYACWTSALMRPRSLTVYPLLLAQARISARSVRAALEAARRAP